MNRKPDKLQGKHNGWDDEVQNNYPCYLHIFGGMEFAHKQPMDLWDG